KAVRVGRAGRVNHARRPVRPHRVDAAVVATPVPRIREEKLAAREKGEIVGKQSRSVRGSSRDALDLSLGVDPVDPRVCDVGAVAGSVGPECEAVRPPRGARDDLGLAVEAAAVDLSFLAAAPDQPVLIESEVLDMVHQAEPDRLHCRRRDQRFAEPHAYLAGAGAESRASRSERCLIPFSILRSMTHEPGVINASARRPPRESPLLIRFRLRSRVPAPSGSSTKAQTQVPSSETVTSADSGSRIRTRIALGPGSFPGATEGVSPTSRCCHSGWTVSALRMPRPKRFSIQS